MLPDYTTAFWITAVAAVFLIGVSKGGFGGGIGVVATPLLALTISVAEAAALLLPLLILVDIFTLRYYWRKIDRAIILSLLPGAVVGILIGWAFFNYFSENDRVLKVALGVIGLLFVAFQLGRRLIFGAMERREPTAVYSTTIGSVSGFTSTLAHVGGPPLLIYLLPQQLPRDVFAATFLAFFFLVNTIKLIPYGFLGLLQVGNVTTMVILIPAAVVGIWIGTWLNKRFTDRWFNIAIYILLIFTSLQLLLG